jgi:hypothetical protein
MLKNQRWDTSALLYFLKINFNKSWQSVARQDKAIQGDIVSVFK